MNYNQMLRWKQFEKHGLTLQHRQATQRREPSPKKMDELYHYMQSEPAAYEFLAAAASASSLNTGEISAAISRLEVIG
jgi:hypothetical protein